MRHQAVAMLAIFFSALGAAGCSRQSDPAPSAAAPAPAPSSLAAEAAATRASAGTTATRAPVPAASKRASACELVTQAEMSAILGGAVGAEAGGNDRPPAATECIYASAAGPSPYAELEVDWGAGDPQVLGVAAGLVTGAGPPGAVDPLQGLGERAYQITADQVFISTQGHLMMIRFPPGTGEVTAMARRIYETARPRM
jgi:hypothetical protein